MNKNDFQLKIIFSNPVMIDGAANILPVPSVEKAIQEGVLCAQKIVSAIRGFASEFGKVKKNVPPMGALSDELKQKIDELVSVAIFVGMMSSSSGLLPFDLHRCHGN